MMVRICSAANPYLTGFHQVPLNAYPTMEMLTSKSTDLAARHAQELEAARQTLLNELVQKHKVESDLLTKQLDRARYLRQEDSNKAERLAHELVDLRNVFDDEKDKYSQSLQEVRQRLPECGSHMRLSLLFSAYPNVKLLTCFRLQIAAWSSPKAANGKLLNCKV